YTLTQPTGLTADITARSLTIAATNTYKAKGEVLTAGTGSLAFTATGLQNGETIGSVTIAYGPAAGATGSGATVGTYAGQVTISAATGGTFNPGNYAITYQGAAITVLNDLVVERLGDGATVINGNAFGIAVLEVSAGGTAIETIVSPFEGANLLTESGNSTSNGHLNTYAGLIAVPGLNTAIGSTNGASAVSGLNVKATNILSGASTTVAGRVTFPTDGTVFGTNNFRSVIATGANTFYATGNGSGTTGGVWYYDGSAFTRVSGSVNNTRNVEIFNGDLFFSTGSGSHGIYQVGSGGLPTAADTVATRIIAVTDPYGFSISPDGNTAFVSSTTNGLVKFTKSAGVWTQAYVVNPVFTRGLYVDYTGPDAVLFATTSAIDPDPANPTNSDFNLGNNKLIRVVDAGAGSTATDVLIAGTSYVFRGVDYAPSTVVATPAIGTTGSFTAVVTVAGTASTATTITVTGSALTGAITATAPAGFEVSSDGTTYGATATFSPASGTVSGTLSIRLAAATAVGSYSGSVSLSSPGATAVSVFMPASTVTSTAVKVTGVFVRGSTWNTGYLGLGEFTTVGADQLGWGLRDGANQLATNGASAAQVTWTNVNRLSLRFNQAIATPAADAMKLIRGNSAGDVTLSPTGVTMLAGNTVAQFAFASALETGRYLVSIAAGGIADSAGTTVLDGEWTNSSSTFAAGSGDGTEGGSFDYQFNVVAGDVNASGSITNTDRSVVVTQLFQTVGSSNFRANLDGSATITNTDVGLVSTKLFQVLGSLPNTPVASSPAVSSPTVAAVTSTSADLGGRLVSTGGSSVIEQGVVILAGSTGTPSVGDQAVIQLLASGTSLGIFAVSATNLTASTTYRFRAFARNALGISYSEIRTFTTAANA
ncbi:MAG: beta strand repeat-containing protein, partial [Planctomycetota bacterium]